MPTSVILGLLLLAGPPAAPPPLDFAPLLEPGTEWSYAPYSEDEQGTRVELAAPGALHLRVALVRPVGKLTVFALVPLLDGVDAERLKSDLELDLPFSPSPIVLAVTKAGLRGLGLSLDEARGATEAQVTASMRASSDPLDFPARPRSGEALRWKFDDVQQQFEAKGRVARLPEQVDGREVQAWAVNWKGKACFAGECVPFSGTQVYAPEAGLLRLCRLSLNTQPAMACLRMIARAAPMAPVPDAPPSLGEIWRVLQTARPAITACLHSQADIAELGFQIEPDGSLSGVKEKNQSGQTAACTVKALGSVHFPSFKGAPRVVERLSFVQ